MTQYHALGRHIGFQYCQYHALGRDIDSTEIQYPALGRDIGSTEIQYPALGRDIGSISTPCSTVYHGKYAALCLLSNIRPPIL